jgi:hypothetical protein
MLIQFKILILFLFIVLFVSCRNQGKECISFPDCKVFNEGIVTHSTREKSKKCKLIDSLLQPVRTKNQYSDSVLIGKSSFTNIKYVRNLHYKF